VNTEDFTFYRDILQGHSGIFLTPEKTYLLTTRLMPLCKTLGFETLDDYTGHIRRRLDDTDLNMIIGAMTTNETSFFRDVKPFHYLKHNILPGFLQRRGPGKRGRIWSAACSTGQEAYSIAMTVREGVEKSQAPQCDIIGTDIADHVLKKAQDGEYNNFEIQRGLSMPMIVRNFTQKDQNWVVKDDLKTMVRFKKFNLLDHMAKLGQFDIIFCRNVLIYFNPETKLKVLQSIYAAMPPDGVLLLGSCENVMSEKTHFTPLENMHGVYIKDNATHLF
jgi:chemotaxis protein methyltransferase CheR